MAKSLIKTGKSGAEGKTEPVHTHADVTGIEAAKPPVPAAAQHLLPWAFFILFFALCLQANPTLQYHIRCPAFYAESSFFNGFLSRPGGLTEYGAAFLIQCHSIPWLGAAVQTGLAMAIYVLFRRVLRSAGGGLFGFAALVPVAFLLPLQNWPASPVVEIVLGLLLSLAILAAWASLRPLPSPARAAALLLLALFSYFASGGFLLFLALLGFLLALGSPKISRIDLVLWPVAAVIIPLASTYWPCILTPRQAYLRLLLFHPQPPATAVLAAFPVVLLTVVAARRFNRRAAERAEPAAATPAGSCAATGLSGIRWPPLPALAALLLLAAGLFLSSRNPDRVALPQLDFYARHGQWDLVLREAGRLRFDAKSENAAASYCASIDIMRALYHQGRLGSDGFAYWHYGSFPLLPSTTSFAWSIQMAELLFEMGQVNYAEHWAHEAMELQGDRPELLMLIAKINQVLERPKAGAVFLGRLAKNPFQTATARRRLDDLRLDPLGTNNLELAAIRKLMPTNDAPSIYLTIESQLHQLLRTNFKNAMAYEYLMIHYLLGRNLEDAVGLMRRMGELGYKTVPRHFEEAFLLYAREKKVNVQKIMGIPISAQTLHRYASFDKALASLAGRPELLLAEMNRQFSDTYWRYYVTETIQAGLAVK